jgi:cytochrome oxidase Cu insertion factor (SCO1/SenC/PrrC family)
MFSTRRKAHAGLLAAFGLLAASFGILAVAATRSAPPPAGTGMRAPDFTLIDTQGTPFSLTSLREKVVVLCFASPHLPTIADLSDQLSAFAAQYSGEPRLQIVRIGSIPEQNISDLRVQARILREPFPTLMDIGGEVAALYRIDSTPVFLVIDPKGVIRYRGAFDSSEFASAGRLAAAGMPQSCDEAVDSLLNPVGSEPAGYVLGASR